jgi:hypothetical protein
LGYRGAFVTVTVQRSFYIEWLKPGGALKSVLPAFFIFSCPELIVFLILMTDNY